MTRSRLSHIRNGYSRIDVTARSKVGACYSANLNVIRLQRWKRLKMCLNVEEPVFELATNSFVGIPLIPVLSKR